MSKKGKFDKACFIPNQGTYQRGIFLDGYKAELEGSAESMRNRKKQAFKRK